MVIMVAYKGQPQNIIKGRIKRAALYGRVSTDEQALRGFSLTAQKENLTEYCEKHKLKIVDYYFDEGISGAKPPLKRPQLKRLLDDVQAGKIDIILFTKVDRWFRSVPEYYKVQEVLDDHKVEWKAIFEDFDTTTANGRMSITIFLALAQNEREKTSERIKVVFENKIKNKECIFGGNSIPFGYINEKDENGVRRLVKDPILEEAIQMFWNIATKYENVSKAARETNLAYGLTRTTDLWFSIVKNPIYTGVYRGVQDYCPAYVSYEDWGRLQKRKSIKKTKNNRVYLFSGLIRCPRCGRTLKSATITNTRKGEKYEYKHYRCRDKQMGTCDYNSSIFEIKTEKWLLKNLATLMNDEIARVEIAKSKPKPKPKTNVAALKEQLRRLEIVYMAGNKSDADYLAESKEIQDAINKAEMEVKDEYADKDLDILKHVLETDFETIYKGLDPEDKRWFWRSIIKEIHVNGTEPVSVEFL